MRLYLDHGIDEASCTSFQLQERGVTFDSPWQFPVMAELSICVDYNHPRIGRCRTPVQGVVVESAKVESGRYETTVLFFGMAEESLLSSSGVAG
jgi:hypothetical protein